MVKEVEGQFDVEGWAAIDESGILSPLNFTCRSAVSSLLLLLLIVNVEIRDG